MEISRPRAKFPRPRIADREAGFTLIELLVVMLILGVLAAIALPAFFNQKAKAGDAKAKETAHAAHVAMETCSTDNRGVYSAANCNLAGLQAIEPTIPATGVVVTAEGTSYTITVTASSRNTFSIRRSATGELTYTCTVNSATNRGGCPSSGTWG